jgi:hypothetical protein
MSLPAATHAAVLAEQKRRRNAGARANRVRVAGVKVLRATDTEGRDYLLALGDKEPSRAYVLRRDKKTGALVCDCFMNKWQKRCAHVEAAEQAEEAAELSEQIAVPQGREAADGEHDHRHEGQHQHQQHDQIEPPGLGRRAVHAAGTLQGAGQERGLEPDAVRPEVDQRGGEEHRQQDNQPGQETLPTHATGTQQNAGQEVGA